MAAIARRVRRVGGGDARRQPRLDYPPYRSSVLRHPTKALQQPTRRASSCGRPCFGHRDVDPVEADLTVQHGGEPIGERMIVTGRVLDGDGRPVRRPARRDLAGQRGRALHPPARPAPGRRSTRTSPASGRCLTDGDGNYRFTTIKPGPYPWRNHRNAWRPAHIHFSLFGTEFTQRLITQMYFPGDPLFALDPIYQSITDPRGPRAAGRDATTTTSPSTSGAPGYRWDIVLTGSHRTPLEEDAAVTALAPRRTDHRARSSATPCRTPGDHDLVPPATPARSGCTAGFSTARATPVPDALLEIRQAGPDGVVPRAAGLAAPRRLDLHRLGPRRHRPGRSLLLHHADPGPATRRRVLLGHGVRPRPARRVVHPGLPARGPPGRTPVLPGLDADGRATLIARRDAPRPALRHPPAGRGRDHLPDPPAT